MDELVKVELGCGATKTEGYIGLDRFPLPGVDIVADLDRQFPIEDNSVDVILACNSLEHLADLYHTMSEIYRICKDGAIIHILAPYHSTATNMANIYHKQVFNEDTFRFFGRETENPFIDQEEWYCPHASIWGLSTSDNSQCDIDFIQVGMEFFYYKEYRHLSLEQKRRARRAFSNVCDMLFYTLVVNKTDHFPMQRLMERRELASRLEPPIIAALRERDKVFDHSTSSILTDIRDSCTRQIDQASHVLQEKITELSSEVEGVSESYQQLEEHLDEIQRQSQALQSDFTAQIQQFQQRLEQGERQAQKFQDDLSQQYAKITTFTEEIAALKRENGDLKERLRDQEAQRAQIERGLTLVLNSGSLEREWTRTRPSSRKYSFWRNQVDLYPAINQLQPGFAEGILLHHPDYKRKSQLCISPPLPRISYYEYQLKGYGDRLMIFLCGTYRTQLEVELVCDGKICKQDILTLNGQDIYSVEAPFRGMVNVRLKVLGDYGVIRTLEITNRWLALFERRNLAAYIE